MTTETKTPSPKLDAIRALVAAGYVLVPLCPLDRPHNHRGKPCRTPGKVPVARDWTSVQAGDYSEQELSAGNYGVVLQADDLVVDADPRNYKQGDDPIARLCKKIGAELHTFTARTGGGGFHYYFKKPKDVAIRLHHEDFQGIDFKTAGGHVVGPGSDHFSGKKYVAVSTSYRTADAPTSLLTLISRAASDNAPGLETGVYADDAQTRGRYLAYLQDVAKPSIQGQHGDSNAFKVACHGRDLGLSPQATMDMMWEVWNPKCVPVWEADELLAKVQHAYKYAKSGRGNEQPSVDFAPILEDPLADAPEVDSKGKKAAQSKVTATDDPTGAPDWRTDSNGRLLKSFHNLLQYFKYAPTGLPGVFAYNEFRSRIEFARPAPWHGNKLPSHRGISDQDLKLLKAHLAVNFKFELPLNNIEEAVTVAAMDNRFHPVREYLDGLKWDGTPRLDFWLRDYLGSPDNLYTRACAWKILCAAIMRVMRPGIQFDHVLVLEGRQGVGKSSVCRILGGEWGSDAPLDPHNKDTVQLMQGQWIIEFAEMNVTKRSDIDALKAFITRPKDQARLAYHRTVVEYPRQCVFIGSINPGADGTYLKDDENRRWWPVACGNKFFDLKGLKAVRNQLFAEAMHRIKKADAAGVSLHMDTPELRAAARLEAEKRHADHPWIERIEGWLAECDAKPETRREFLTVRDVFIGAMGGADKQLDRASSHAISDVLKALGWKYETTDKKVKGWRRPDVGLDILGDLL